MNLQATHGIARNAARRSDAAAAPQYGASMRQSSKYTPADVFLECLPPDPDAKPDAMRETPRFQMFAHRSIYLDGWLAVCPVVGSDQSHPGPDQLLLTEEQLQDLDASGWELYNLLEDPGETQDLAGVQRQKLLEMIALWYATGTRHDA
jgi:arylsulfatase A-like enzyme